MNILLLYAIQMKQGLLLIAVKHILKLSSSSSAKWKFQGVFVYFMIQN